MVVSVLYMRHVVRFSACFAVSVQVAFVAWASSIDIDIGVGIARRCDRAANLRDNCYVKRRQRRRNDIQAVSMFSLCFLVWPRVSNLFSDRWGKESQNDHPSNFTY